MLFPAPDSPFCSRHRKILFQKGRDSLRLSGETEDVFKNKFEILLTIEEARILFLREHFLSFFIFLFFFAVSFFLFFFLPIFVIVFP